MYPKTEDEEFWRTVTIKRKRASQNNNMRSKKVKNTPRPMEIIKKYSEETTVHGFRYISMEGAGYCHRILWIVAVLVCAIFAIFFVVTAWNKFTTSPIITTVESTDYPLSKLPFPAVTVCPTTMIRKRIGEELLTKYLKDNHLDESNSNATLMHFMRALTSLRFPYYHRIKQDLSSITNRERFAKFNISEFMLKVLPPENEIFHSCSWQGREINCTEIFELQRYEGGFCYSFNSLTSETTKRCSGIDDTVIVDNNHEKKNYFCMLLHNPAAGTTTGLEVFFKPSKVEDHIGNGNRDAMGVKILLHDSAHYPDTDNELFMLDKKFKVGTIKIVASVIESDSNLRDLTPQERNCYFDDELMLNTTTFYSEENCLVECRLQFIDDVCHCRPYFFSEPIDNVRECNIMDLDCIIEYSRDLRMYTATTKFREAIEIKDSTTKAKSLNCSYCLPSCNGASYVSDMSFSENSKPSDDDDIGYLNVYYSERTAVKYMRAPAVDKMQLLVSFGGIIGLFLGVSLLSGVELVYYIAKLCRSFYEHYMKKQLNHIRPTIIHSNMVNNTVKPTSYFDTSKLGRRNGQTRSNCGY